MYHHTIGGVIETGRPIVKILPANAPLIIEVLVPRANIDSVSVNQEARVRLTGLNQRMMPALNGLVDDVSAMPLPTDPQVPAARCTCRASRYH